MTAVTEAKHWLNLHSGLFLRMKRHKMPTACNAEAITLCAFTHQEAAGWSSSTYLWYQYVAKVRILRALVRSQWQWRRAWRVQPLLLWVFYPAYLKSSVCLHTSRGGSWKDQKPPSRQRLLKMCWQLLNKVLNIKIAISVFAANYLENF